MKKQELIPKPNSHFIRVKCPECGNEQITFNKASAKILCTVCKAILAEPTGGTAIIKGEILEKYD